MKMPKAAGLSMRGAERGVMMGQRRISPVESEFVFLTSAKLGIKELVAVSYLCTVLLR